MGLEWDVLLIALDNSHYNTPTLSVCNAQQLSANKLYIIMIHQLTTNPQSSVWLYKGALITINFKFIFKTMHCYSCKQGLMSHACTPILVGMVSPVSELWLIFDYLQNGQNFPSDHGLQSMVIKKFNRLELAQKNYANRN